MAWFTFRADPTIYIFPRKKENLFLECYDPSVKEEKLVTKKILPDSYKKSDTFEPNTDDIFFNSIEERLYADLATEEDQDTYLIKKYFSVGFITERKKNTYYFLKHDSELDVLSECKDTRFTCSLSWFSAADNSTVTNDNDRDLPILVKIKGKEDQQSCIQNVCLTIRFDRTIDFKSVPVKIKIKHHNQDENKYISKEFNIYRNNQSKLEDFNFKSKNKEDEDFFIIPINNASKNQKAIIKELQIINNQVFARNKKLTDFNFVQENGILDESQNLIKNIKNSITAFRTKEDDLTAGCRSGNDIYSNLKTNYPYNFENYGSEATLLDYLSSEYSIEKEKIQGRILDRNFLFGNYFNGNADSKIEGIVNLLNKVVTPFIKQMMDHAQEYIDFNRRWMYCPKYCRLYQRGNFTTVNSSKKLYNSETGNDEYQLNTTNNTLPAGTIVEFEAGCDKYAFDKGQETHRYKIKAIKIPNSTRQTLTAWINLNLAEKKTCDDREYIDGVGKKHICNYSWSTEITNSVNKKDKTSLMNYQSSNGIPYYMGGDFDGENPMGKKRKMKSFELLEWNEDSETVKNWYSYTNKPNTKDFGIDCSGFVVNVYSFPKFDQNHEKMIISDDFEMKAEDIGNKLCRKVPKTENVENISYLTTGDTISWDGHICMVAEDNISTAHLSDRYFNIVHAVGMLEKKEIVNAVGISEEKKIDNYLHLTYWNPITNSNDYHEGCFVKVLTGAFRHCGRDIYDTNVDVTVGRLYLWN